MAQMRRNSPPVPGPGGLVRTSVLVPVELDRKLRELAERAERPYSWEVRRALEDYVEREEVAA